MSTSSTTTASLPTTKQPRSLRRSTSQSNTGAGSDSKDVSKLRRVRIQSLKEVHSVEEPTNPEVEFIIQVKSSKGKQSSSRNKNASASGNTVNSINNSSPVKKSSGTPTLPGSSSSGSSGSSGTSEEDEGSDDDVSSVAGTDTTETTLVDRNENELQEQIESLKQELETMRARCERVEREKSDILLRRIAALDTTPSKTAASEVLKLQQKVNELQSQAEDLRDDKKSLNLRVKELKEELEGRPDKVATQRTIDELQSKLLAAETLCEELMDENEDMKKELRDLEEEIEEMQDNFREDQADEYTSLKKELEQTNKNCRILSFKLRKAERKAEQLEAEKLEVEKKFKEVAGGQTGLEKVERVKKLEQELAVANEVAVRLQKELDETNAKLKAKEEANNKEATKKKAPMLGTVGKVSSGEKVSRASLTRGGSQEDPQQLLRDLQDSLEREADLREQLRFAEEEAQTLRKKASRVEDDNESLVLQLKKMATKARSRRHSPSPARLTPEPSVEKDEGISDEEDPAELRILLELNEQEAAVLRRKVEELESEGENMKHKLKELQDKLIEKTARKNTVASLASSEPAPGNALHEQKLKVLEAEVSELRMKLIEKERDCERLHAELTLTQKRVSKGSIQKSKSLDSGSEQQALDLKRQLQVIEQEAAILRTKTQTLESDNEKLAAENKQLHLQRIKKWPLEAENETTLKAKITSLETKLTDANNKVKELEVKLKAEEATKLAAEEDQKKKPGLKDTAEVTRLKKELKMKTEELSKLQVQARKSEEDNENLTLSLKRLKEDAVSSSAKFYRQRTPKKPTDLTSKVQLKKMVEDLENEIGEVLVLLKKSETEKSKLQEGKGTAEDKVWKAEKEKLQKQLDENKKEMEELENSLMEERDNAEREKKKAVEDIKAIEEGRKMAEEECSKLEEEKKVWKEEIKKLEEDKKKLEEERNRAHEEVKKLSEDQKRLNEEVVKVNAERAAAIKKQEEIAVFMQRIEALKTELEIEQQQGASLRQKLEVATKVEQEKIKLQIELMEKTKKITEAEKKVKEVEEKMKRNEKLLSNNKTKINRLEKELEEEKEKVHLSESQQQDMTSKWLAERDVLKEQLSDLQTRNDSLQTSLVNRDVAIEKLEVSMKEEMEKAMAASARAGSAENKEIKSLRAQLAGSKAQAQELMTKLEKVEKLLKAAEEKLKTHAEEEKSKADLDSKISTLEVNLQAEKKKCERMKVSHEKELKNREEELSSLRSKLRSLEGNSGSNSKKVTEIKEEYQSQIDKLEEALATERHEYEDLTAKYEILEEEHVVTKAQLVMDKEAVQTQLLTTKRELVVAENELRTLQDTYSEKQDMWIKEKLDLQEKLKELEEKVLRSNSSDSWVLERTRLKSVLEDKCLEVEQLKKETDMNADQMEHLRKENDELRKKLEDFDKVVKVHRNMSADTSAIEKELQATKNKLYEEERAHKADMAQLKLRYDSRVAVISEEIQGLQGQVCRFKRERDTFRHMLEGAQRTIADLKASSGRESRSSGSNVDESEETQTKIQSLEQQISCMEDELSEARLEASKLKTELISERSAWEVKLSEIQSHVNELEEDRIISSGRTKIPGMRTRMELAWQKEREEQHRLLQETSTLARDLRQTLFEVERERDKERLEAKRRLDQLKKSTEEEQEENRKKVTEVQCDLLELRDAHAKLRTTNEKLRREKERNEKEREELRQLASGKRRAEQEEDRRINILLEQVDELTRLAPELFLQKSTPDSSSTSSLSQPTPVAPKRLKGPKSRESSRESSPQLQRKDFQKETSVDRKLQLQSTVQRLSEVTEELRRFQRLSEEERDRERAKRMLGLRRAASTESDNPPDSSLQSKPLVRSAAGLQKKGSLYRKSLSLEQTSGQDQSIWKGESDNEGSLSSLQSLEAGAEAFPNNQFFTLQKRESSTDSRLSGGSTQSDVLQSKEKKKKKGLFGKLKKLTKSRSIDDGVSEYTIGMSQGGSGSDVSMSEDKGGMKDRLTGIFRKSGSTSRDSSMERSPAIPERTDSTQRPLVKQSSNNTLPRTSPARSDVSASSSSRPLASCATRSQSPATSSTPSRGRK
ncbi:hypothetical protein B7P43_G11349 [Cryptotermes secundus]|nr:hypothetical protein B7P43_G11349 [Cryptotermes secundus]